MKLTVKSINIHNFKGFESLKYDPNDKFNIIIGENNVGKSTIFEAIQLWKRCYDLSIKADDKGFYKTNSKQNLYLPFAELYFLRVTNDRELFNTNSHTTTINLTISNGSRDFKLSYEIVKPPTISNAYYKVRSSSDSDFDAFSDFLNNEKIKLSKAVFIYQTRPVASVLSHEPIMNIGQISKKIEKGKSQEVLRNKIVAGRTQDKLDELTEIIRSIVNYDFEFEYANRSKKDTDEYIELKVKYQGKSLDLHLQGSGFLQVAEIFSTINYVDAPLSLLLVDEPDSHIHTTLQKSLIKKLKSITASQIMVISHNDNFVGESEEGELFYLNSQSKNDGELKSIKLKDFDLVKKELGGTILALERMNNCTKFVFVEGDDDAKYIEYLYSIYNKFSVEKLSHTHVTFFHQRGKDYLQKKIENVNRVFTQIVGRKPYIIVYDKDYSTTESNHNFKQCLLKAAPRNSQCFSHDGYCIESILFENILNLSSILHKATNLSVVLICKFIREFRSDFEANCCNVTSELYSELKSSFDGQKKVSRPELNTVDFPDFINDSYDNGSLKFGNVMNKHQIKKFVKAFNANFNIDLINLDDDESSDNYSAKLFSLYMSKITHIKYLPENYKNMLETIYTV